MLNRALSGHSCAIGATQRLKCVMESKLALQAKLAVLAATQRLSPEQRLNAFLVHCQLMTQLRLAGQRIQTPLRSSRS